MNVKKGREGSLYTIRVFGTFDTLGALCCKKRIIH